MKQKIWRCKRKKYNRCRKLLIKIHRYIQNLIEIRKMSNYKRLMHKLAKVRPINSFLRVQSITHWKVNKFWTLKITWKSIKWKTRIITSNLKFIKHKEFRVDIWMVWKMSLKSRKMINKQIVQIMKFQSKLYQTKIKFEKLKD